MSHKNRWTFRTQSTLGLKMRLGCFVWFRLFWLRKMLGHTERVMGPTWEVRSCLMGPALRNSLLGVIIQKPTGGASAASTLIHPWTVLTLFSQEYWYLSSTWAQHRNTIISFIHGHFEVRTPKPHAMTPTKGKKSQNKIRK